MSFLKQFRIKEVLRFGVGGGSAVAVDFVLYILLGKYLPVSMAKAISFTAGAAVGFIINKLWTFESKRFSSREVARYCVLYACSATVNALVNKGVLALSGITVLAFLVATGCSTLINFLGQKFFVFRKMPDQ